MVLGLGKRSDDLFSFLFLLFILRAIWLYTLEAYRHAIALSIARRSELWGHDMWVEELLRSRSTLILSEA